MNIVYAKKFRFPDPSANVIQGLNMVSAFASSDVNIKSLLSFANNITDRNFYLHRTYGISKDSLGDTTWISKQARGLRYSYWLLRAIMADPTATIYTRENTEFSKALLLKRITRLPFRIIHEVHKLNSRDSDNLTPTKTKFSPIFRKLSQANGLVFIDENLQNQIMNNLASKIPTLVAPSGANIVAFSPRETPQPSSDVLIGYFGTISEEKGVFLLADALRYLPKNYRLKLVGRTTPQAQEEILRRIGNDTQRIIFTGHLNPSELPDAMADVHISVIPSISRDKFLSPLKLAESLALGLPLVCTPVEHLKSLVRDGSQAFFSTSLQPHDLAQAISRLAESPDIMSRMRTENRRYAHFFSWDNRAKKIIEFIDSLYSVTQK